MMIEKILIENFRSIERLEIEPHYLTALVGPNSAGKTNVLKALNILLGEIFPTEKAFSKDDFYKRETNKSILIQVWFSEPLQTCRLTSCDTRQKTQCSPVSLKITHTRNEEVNFGATSFLAIELDGSEYWATNEVREQVGFVYIPSDRNLEKQMTISQWTLLGKMLRKIDENFRKKEEGETLSQVETQFRDSMIPPREILESEFEGDLNYKIFKDTFIEICKENTKGLANDFSLDLEIYDPLFYYKTIQIIGREELGNFNVQELGSGVQNLVLLSLFKTYAKLMKSKAILAIEEPEIYLYPQAQRQLYQNFRSLAYPKDDQPGTQIFYTTHNPSFVDASKANEVEILYKDKARGSKTLKKDLNYLTTDALEQDKFKIYTHFNTERNELFFANKIILVEGHSDKILWTTLCFEKWNIDVNKENVSIIECGGKTGVLYFIGVCKLLGISDYFAIWDQDNNGQEIVDTKNILPTTITDGKGLEIPENIEKFLRQKFPVSDFPQYSFIDNNKVQNSYEWAHSVNTEQIPTEFEVVKNFLQTSGTDTDPTEEAELIITEELIPF